MLNNIPIIGWLLDILFKISLSIIFTPFWNWLAPEYFDFLPEKYLQLGFWEVVGIFIILGILKQFSPLSIDNSNSNE